MFGRELRYEAPVLLLHLRSPIRHPLSSSPERRLSFQAPARSVIVLVYWRGQSTCSLSLEHTRDGSRGLCLLGRHREALLNVAVLSRAASVLAWRRRVETDAGAAVLAVLVRVCGGGATSEAAGCTADGASHVPLTLLCEPPEGC